MLINRFDDLTCEIDNTAVNSFVSKDRRGGITTIRMFRFFIFCKEREKYRDANKWYWCFFRFCKLFLWQLLLASDLLGMIIRETSKDQRKRKF